MLNKTAVVQDEDKVLEEVLKLMPLLPDLALHEILGYAKAVVEIMPSVQE